MEELYRIRQVHLVMNRIQPRLLRQLRTTIDDAMDAAGLPSHRGHSGGPPGHPGRQSGAPLILEGPPGRRQRLFEYRQTPGGLPGPCDADPVTLNCIKGGKRRHEYCYHVSQPQAGADGPVLHRILRTAVQATLYAPPTPLAEWWRRLPACPSICSSPTSTGASEQIGQRIIYNEIDMVLFFNYPQDTDMDDNVMYITRLCDQHSVPMATNVATAEMLIHGLARGDLDWRIGMNPNRVPFAL